MKIGILLLCVGTQVQFASAARRAVVSRHHAQVAGDTENDTESDTENGAMCKAVLLKLLNIIDYDDREGISGYEEARMKRELLAAISAAHYSSTTEDWIDLISRVSTLLYTDFSGSWDANAIITTKDLNDLIRCSVHRTTMQDLEDVVQTQDGSKIIEGDIVVPSPYSLLEQSQWPANLSSSVLETQPRWRRSVYWAGELWPNGEIPWCFHPNGVHEQVQRTWHTVLEDIQARTCVRFRQVGVRRGTAECSEWPSVIVQSHEEGCWSYVGMQRLRGSQQINLQHGSRGTCATPGIIAHEVGHSMGMSHEQSRADRDNYVTVNWNNIEKDLWNNFEIDKAYTGDTYDIFSLMHYGAYDFAIDRRVPTISPQEREHMNIMGQRVGFSAQDISQINKMYSCPVHESHLPERCGGHELNDDANSRCYAKETCSQCRTRASSALPTCDSLKYGSWTGQNALCTMAYTENCKCNFRISKTQTKKRKKVLYRGRYYYVDDEEAAGPPQTTLTCDSKNVLKLYNKDGSQCYNYRYTRQYSRQYRSS